MWTVTPSGTYLGEIRDDIEAELSTTVDWTGTVDGAWTIGAAELAFRVDQSGALLLSTMLLDTAPASVVTARALDALLEPRAATRSRYIVEANGSGELVTGSTVQAGGPLGRSQWVVVDDTATVVTGDKVTIEAVDTGIITLTSPLTLTLVAPVVGLSELTYDSADGDAFQVGRVAETRSQLIVRIRAERGGAGSEPELRNAILELDWVVATNIYASGGVLAVTVAPAPVGTDQTAELANAIYANSLGVTYSGAVSTTITDVNGDDLTINYTVGTTEDVAVVIVLTLDGTVSASDAIDSATSAVGAIFTGLSNGDAVYRLAVLASLSLPGVTGASLTMNGGTADSITPANAADILTPTITAAAA